MSVVVYDVHMATDTRTRRIAPGVYETPAGFRIQRGYSEGVRTGGPVLNGWDVIDPDGEWCERYGTKADALDSLR